MNRMQIILLAAATLVTASNANAALETWELKATIASHTTKTTGYVFPSFLSVGSAITIYYVFDDQAPLQPTCCSSPDPVQSVTFNGETSALGKTEESDGIGSGSLNAINAGFEGRQNDAVTFISFNDIFATTEPNMQKFLQSFHDDLNTYYSPGNIPRITYRIDLDKNAASAYATVTSFNEVPVPSALYLFSSAIAGIFWGKARRMRSPRQTSQRGIPYAVRCRAYRGDILIERAKQCQAFLH